MQETLEMSIQFLVWEDSLEEAWPPTPVLAWRITWTEEPGSLQSIGVQRVRYD